MQISCELQARIDHRGEAIHFGMSNVAGVFDLEASESFGIEAEQVRS